MAPANKNSLQTLKKGPLGIQHPPQTHGPTNPPKKRVKRLVRLPQHASTQLQQPRPALMSHIQSKGETDGWDQRRNLRQVDRKVGVMSAEFIQLKKMEAAGTLPPIVQIQPNLQSQTSQPSMQNQPTKQTNQTSQTGQLNPPSQTTMPTLPHLYNSYADLRIILGYLEKEPRLFQAPQAEAMLALGWTMLARDTNAHMWLRRALKWRHEYLSAVYILAGPAMVNDPDTTKLAKDTLATMGLLPLKKLPPT